ncbi:hypothetical protein [Flavobacterium sp.]|uniref:hypothetical protein n=1 Tax=Flavobacterium sp. TaxID=239 RepID=UPI0037537627
MRKLLFLLFAGIAISLTSCRDDFAFEPSTGGLEFSKDTVYLDTVFTNIGSSTYRLKVYNRSDKDISIPKIQLGKGITSKYRIMVDGMTGDAGAQGKIFSNVELLAKDSLFIFIEVTSDVASANPTDFLYTDQIQFTNISGAPQTVELVTLIQDAYFIYPSRTQNPDNSYTYENITLGLDDANQPVTIIGSKLDHSDPMNGDEFLWKRDKPYVVYGYAIVPDTETLNIQDGARIHFHANSGLIISKNATLRVNGLATNNPDNLSKEVVFEGDRLEPDFSDVPGQWGTILFYSKKTDNVINHLTVKNATVGILMQNLALLTDNDVPNLTINNSQIYNCSNVGLLARKSTVTSENLVINSCGEASLACTYGGTYNFTHGTFNNNWSSSKQVAVLLNDYLETSTTLYVNNPTNIFNFTNCIIFGSNQVEFFIDRKGTFPFLHNLKNTLIKFNNSQLNDTGFYNFNAASGPYNNCYISKNNTNYLPKFKNIASNKLWPTQDLSIAPSLMLALPTSVSTDILGKNRTPTVSIGAYQFIP